MKAIAGWLAGPILVAAGMAYAQTPSGSVAPAAPKQWSIEDFAALPMMDAPALSPDGLRIASLVAVAGEQKLVIADIADGPNRIRSLALGDNDLNWWKWVNDDWLIVGLGGETNVDGYPWYISRVAALKRDGTKINLIAKNIAAQSADDVIWVARDGTPRILLSYQRSIFYNQAGFWPRVDEVDVSTGRLHNVITPREMVRSWYANGTVRMGVGYNDSTRTSKLLYRPDLKTSFRVVDRADRRRDESLVVPLLFTADPTRAIASNDSDGTDALYELDLGTLELGKKLFEAPGFDLGSVLADSTGSGLAGVRSGQGGG